MHGKLTAMSIPPFLSSSPPPFGDDDEFGEFSDFNPVSNIPSETSIPGDGYTFKPISVADITEQSNITSIDFSLPEQGDDRNNVVSAGDLSVSEDDEHSEGIEAGWSDLMSAPSALTSSLETGDSGHLPHYNDIPTTLVLPQLNSVTEISKGIYNHFSDTDSLSSSNDSSPDVVPVDNKELDLCSSSVTNYDCGDVEHEVCHVAPIPKYAGDNSLSSHEGSDLDSVGSDQSVDKQDKYNPDPSTNSDLVLPNHLSDENSLSADDDMFSTFACAPVPMNDSSDADAVSAITNADIPCELPGCGEVDDDEDEFSDFASIPVAADLIIGAQHTGAPLVAASVSELEDDGEDTLKTDGSIHKLSLTTVKLGLHHASESQDVVLLAHHQKEATAISTKDNSADDGFNAFQSSEADIDDDADLSHDEVSTKPDEVPDMVLKTDDDDDDFDDFEEFKMAAVTASGGDPVDETVGETDEWNAFSGDVTAADVDDWAAFQEPPPAEAVAVMDSRPQQPASVFSSSPEVLLSTALSVCFPTPDTGGEVENVSTLPTFLLNNKSGGETSGRGKRTSNHGISVWNELKVMENTPALKFQWSSSHSKDLLLKAVNIDPRNILTSTHHRKSAPMFASNLGLLEPKKATSDVLRPTPVSSFQDKPEHGSTDRHRKDSSKTADVKRHEKELLDVLQLSNVEPVQSTTRSTSLDTILKTIKSSSTAVTIAPTSTIRRTDGSSEPLSAEASAVLARLPDLSFMHAKVLMFPVSDCAN